MHKALYVEGLLMSSQQLQERLDATYSEVLIEAKQNQFHEK